MLALKIGAGVYSVVAFIIMIAEEYRQYCLRNKLLTTQYPFKTRLFMYLLWPYYLLAFIFFFIIAMFRR